MTSEAELDLRLRVFEMILWRGNLQPQEAAREAVKAISILREADPLPPANSEHTTTESTSRLS